MVPSDFRPWLKNVACLSSLITRMITDPELPLLTENATQHEADGLAVISQQNFTQPKKAR